MAQRIIEKIYTDGACSGNPGPGGWGAAIYFQDGQVQDLGGSQAGTTNNRMELQAAIGALKAYEASGQQEPITLYTDSEYVRNGITKWISGWKKKGWKTAAGKAVLNQDLWEELDALNSSKITWQYVKGHAGDPGNERADTIAVRYAQGQLPAGTHLDLPQPSVVTQLAPKAESNIVAEQPSIFTVTPTPVPAAPVEAAPMNLSQLLDRLRIADAIAEHGYLITTVELAELVGLDVKAVGDRGEKWTWRNWQVAAAPSAGEEILWQLARAN
jgi:ribonuclease HI